jgi:purine-nucleoside phosphorylase
LFYQPAIAGNNPLRGVNDEDIGPRFPAVSDAYDEQLQSIVIKCARDISIGRLIRQDGTYCYVSGPAYESRAESRFLRSIGGDAVGMSTGMDAAYSSATATDH